MVDLLDENGQVQVIPTFWAAMEVLEKAHTEAIYNEKTDVWSFGVTCWEILTRTKVLPYEDVWHNEKIVYMSGTRDKTIKQIEEVSNVLYKALKNGKRLCQPRNCVETLWTTILSCWSENPTSRPSFSELMVKFENYLQEPKAYIKVLLFLYFLNLDLLIIVKDNRKISKDQLVFDFNHWNQDRLREILESTDEYLLEDKNERSKLVDRSDITI
uniref:Protein kinase domain-containing protein n=1 Tax=Acrobeloides nanus TaxID=290746 RepID=A0A914EEZ7_9BILA